VVDLLRQITEGTRLLFRLVGRSEWARFGVAADGASNKHPLRRSAIRWYNDCDVAKEIIEVFGFTKVKDFCKRARPVQNEVDGADADDDWAQELAALDRKLISFVDTEENGFKLNLELLLLVHYGKELHSACYDLEGDGPLLPYVHGHLRSVRAVLNVELAGNDLLPDVQGFIDNDLTAVNQRQGWIEWCKERIKPARVYLAKQELKQGGSAHRRSRRALPSMALLGAQHRAAGTPGALGAVVTSRNYRSTH